MALPIGIESDRLEDAQRVTRIGISVFSTDKILDEWLRANAADIRRIAKTFKVAKPRC